MEWSPVTYTLQSLNKPQCPVCSQLSCCQCVLHMFSLHRNLKLSVSDNVDCLCECIVLHLICQASIYNTCHMMVWCMEVLQHKIAHSQYMCHIVSVWFIATAYVPQVCSTKLFISVGKLSLKLLKLP